MSPIRRMRRWYREVVIKVIAWYHVWKERRARRKLETLLGKSTTFKDHQIYDLLDPEDIPGMPDPDGGLSLYKEKLEGRNAREDAGLPVTLPPPPPEATGAPTFRKDGQVHNFEALSWGKKFTRKQYEARHEGWRPAPRRGAHTIDETPDDSPPGAYSTRNYNNGSNE